MFGIGMNEMLVIAVIALVVVGPKRLPEVARALGGMMAKLRRATNELRDVVNEEISSHAEFKDLNDLKNAGSELKRDLSEFTSTARRYVEQGAQDIERTAGELVDDPGLLTSPETTPPETEPVPGGLPTAEPTIHPPEQDAGDASDGPEPYRPSSVAETAPDDGTRPAAGEAERTPEQVAQDGEGDEAPGQEKRESSA